MRHIFVTVVIFFTLIQNAAVPAENIPPHDESLQTLIQAALRNHPDIAVYTAVLEQKKTLSRSAAQVPNLEFNSRLLYSPDENGVEGEYTLFHTFETGGRRNARVAVARSLYKRKELEILIKKQDIVKELITMLYRLRQIQHETAAVKESIRTYSAQLRKYNRLPGLNPELEISRHIFRNVLDENRIILAGISAEHTSLIRNITLFTGIREDEIKKVTTLPSSWPEIPVNTGKGPYAELSEKIILEAEGRQVLAESLPWPDLRIGPSIAHSGGNDGTETRGGVSFSFSIPLYHQNQGEREFAERGVALAKVQVSAAAEKISSLRASWIVQYNTLRERLQSLDHMVDRNPAHGRVHALMNRGLVSTSLIVEAHRQEYSFLKTYHETQLKALGLLWGIYGIDGIIFREVSND